MDTPRPLAGLRIAITRPAGTGTSLARRVRVLGGTPLLLPGSSLHPSEDSAVASEALRIALACDIAIFTSPAAVRFACGLDALHTRAKVLAPGKGTLHALRRAGIENVTAPAREDSEGLLDLPILCDVRSASVGIIGAAGGRGLLERELAARGARVMRAHVYRRLPARLDHRHLEALLSAAGEPLYVLLSSAEALRNILASLPADACKALLAGTAVASSERLADAAHTAGFKRVLRAASAHADALLDAVIGDQA